MRDFILILSAGVAFSLGGCGEYSGTPVREGPGGRAAAAARRAPVIADQVTTIAVSGMHCAGCEQRVEEKLLALKGVATADADHESGEVVVTHDSTAVGRVMLDTVNSLEPFTTSQTVTARLLAP